MNNKLPSWKCVLKLIAGTVLVFAALQAIITLFIVSSSIWSNRDRLCEGLGGFALCHVLLPLVGIVAIIVIATLLLLSKTRARHAPRR